MTLLQARWKPFLRNHLIGLVFLVGFIHGLIYVFLIPPWQHYDEPGHFENAWLFANLKRQPAAGEFDQSMRRELAASMIEHRFFDRMSFRSNLLSHDEAIWIGISQTDDLPLYYLIVSLPLRLVRTSDIRFQLYLGRLTSVFLLLFTLISAYGSAVAITPPAHPLRWMLVAGLALLPGFIDIMSACNNDAGATAFFSLFFWAGILIITRGISWLRLLGLAISAGLCFFTKNTVALAFMLAIIPLMFAVLRGSRQRYTWLALAIMFCLGLATTISWGEASGWYRYFASNRPARVPNDQAPFGRYVFQFDLQPDQITERLVQPIPASEIADLRDKQLVLGAWIWASQPANVWTPFLKDDVKSTGQTISVTEKPTFYAIPVALSPTSRRAQVVLAPEIKQVERPLTVYYDGIVILDGEGASISEPEVINSNATQGIWQKQEFHNPVRNASAEYGGPWLRPWADRLMRSFTPVQPSLILTALFDWPVTGRYFQATIKNLHQTFWARFGWGNVALVFPQVYTILWSIIALSGLGSLMAVIRLSGARKWPSWGGGVLTFTLVTLLWVWLAALLRGLTSLLGGSQFIPSSRYAFPAIIPTMLLISMGLFELSNRLTGRLHLVNWLLPGIYLSFYAALDILCWISIARFYST